MKTKRDHSFELAAETRKDSGKAFDRVILSGTILIFLHLLDIKPAEFEAAGFKFAIADPSIVYGLVALVFINYIHSMVIMQSYIGGMYNIRLKENQIRSSLAAARRKDKTGNIRSIKQSARIRMWILNTSTAPYGILIALAFTFAVAASVYDLFHLATYIFKHSKLVTYITSTLTAL